MKKKRWRREFKSKFGDCDLATEEISQANEQLTDFRLRLADGVQAVINGRVTHKLARPLRQQSHSRGGALPTYA